MTAIGTNIPPPNAPLIDKNGNISVLWWQFLLTLFIKTGGVNSLPDLSQIFAALNETTENADFQSVIQQDPGLQIALRKIDDVISNIQSQQNFSDIYAKIDALERAEIVPPEFTKILRKIDEIESLIFDTHSPLQTSPEQWNAPVLLNSWVYFGSPHNPPGYYKDVSGTVRLRGMVKSGVINTPIFTLPAGYRPAYREIFPVISGDAFGGCYVDTNGNVQSYIGNNTYYSIDGLTFRAA